MKDKKFRTPGLRLGAPSIAPNLPIFSRIRIPLPGGVYLGGGKLIAVSMSAVIVGFVAAMFLLISTGDQELTWPMSGASYDAPSHVGQIMLDDEEPAVLSQTLQINLPSGLRIDEITLTNISLGAGGIVDAFRLAGTSTTDRLTIDTLIIKNSEFPTMDFANGDIYSVVATSSVVVAGHTFAMTMSSSTNDVAIGSGRGSTSYIASDMVVDRILINQTTTGGDVLIGTLTLDGVKAWIGAFNADYFEIGTLILENLRIGDDGDINSPSLNIHASVSVNNVLDGVVEKPIFIR
jgi:hypothetical protein